MPPYNRQLHALTHPLSHQLLRKTFFPPCLPYLISRRPLSRPALHIITLMLLFSLTPQTLTLTMKAFLPLSLTLAMP